MTQQRRRPALDAHEGRLYQLQAEIAKAVAHPVRLRILTVIGPREVPYGALLGDLGISRTNLSRHPAILRRCTTRSS